MRRRDFLRLMALAPAAGAAEPARPRKVGVLGVAHAHAAGKVAALRALPTLFEIVGVAEPETPRQEAARRAAAYQGLAWRTEAELLDDPMVRGVAVETTLAASTGTALRAIQAGKHVHLDKPGGADHAAFAALRQEAERRGLALQMGYMLRYNPGLILVREALAAGWIGEVTRLEAGMGKLADAALRRALLAHPGHGMLELGCHLVDLTVTLLGAPLAIVATAEATQPDGLPDRQQAVLRYARATATLRCDHADPAARRWLTIEGTRGALRVPNLEGNVVNLELAQAAGPHPAGLTTVRRPTEGRYDAEFRDWARLLDGVRPRWDAAHDIAVHAAARRAAGLA